MSIQLQTIGLSSKKIRYPRQKRIINQQTNSHIPLAMENMLVQAKKDFEQGKGFTRLRTPKDIEAWLGDD